MARLQDFQAVTPAGSDNLLIVQSQGQGLSTLNAVGQKVATETTISSLNTTSKNLVGAVNEVNSKKASDIEYSSGVTVKQAIDSKANTSSLSTVATSGNYDDLLNKPIHFRGTLGLDVMQVMKDLPNNSICCYTDSNNPTNQPTGHAWGSYFMYKTNGGARAYYSDNDCFAVSSRVTSSSSSITWRIFT